MKHFWGYNSEEEARIDWPFLDDGNWTTKEMIVATEGKDCTGSLDGKVFKYADGSSDSGITIITTTVIYENNEIKFRS